MGFSDFMNEFDLDDLDGMSIEELKEAMLKSAKYRPSDDLTREYLNNHKHLSLLNRKICSIFLPQGEIDSLLTEDSITGTLKKKGKRIELLTNGRFLPIKASTKRVKDFLLRFPEDEVVTLFGSHVQANHEFSVHTITPDFNNGVFEDMSIDHFNTLINRACGFQIVRDPQSTPINSMDEIEAVFKYFPSLFPEDFVPWAYQKMEEAGAKASLMDSDKRKHARLMLQLIVNIDWFPAPVMPPSVNDVRESLDKKLFGQTAAKEALLSIVATMRRCNGRFPTDIVPVFLGSPGTGKTELVKAFADSLKLPVLWYDFSTMDTGEDLCGSSPLFQNGTSSEIIDKAYANRSIRMVVVLNELDKALGQFGAMSYGTSLKNALLSWLDGQGGKENYLKLSIPTSNILFLGTANTITEMPGPLRSRIQIIPFHDYSVQQKEKIISDFIIPASLSRHNTRPEEFSVSKQVIHLMAKDYGQQGIRAFKQMSETILSKRDLLFEEHGIVQSTYTVSDLYKQFGIGSRKPLPSPHTGQAYAAIADIYGNIHFVEINCILSRGGVPGTKLLNIYPPLYGYAERALAASMKSIADDCEIILDYRGLPQDPALSDTISLASYVAIRSANDETTLPLAIYVGSIDIYSRTKLETPQIGPILELMDTMEISTLFAPLGTKDLATNMDIGSYRRISIIEAESAADMYDVTTLLIEGNGKYK